LIPQVYQEKLLLSNKGAALSPDTPDESRGCSMYVLPDIVFWIIIKVLFMSENKLTGLNHFFKAFHWSLAGFKAAWQNETAFRQEVIGTILFVPLGYWLGETALEKALLIASLLLVLVVELINSAIEAVVDRIGPEHHTLSGRAKDRGSAAVFVTLAIAGVIWGLLLLEKFSILPS
jgi:diacylglycerol kinase (ATP)